MTQHERKILIIGAGPAGLTAAKELQAAGFSNITILEADQQVGGISRTVNYKGNRIDIGGHRFFSKSDWVMNWWANILPLKRPEKPDAHSLAYQGQRRDEFPNLRTTEEDTDDVLLLRNRLSRIYFNKQFFDYPLKLSPESLRKLGLKKTVTFGFSYVWAKLNPIKPEKSLEDFLINRFGRGLYRQFFKEYTEKVWGLPCDQISAEWGAQRIKSLSILSALANALKKALGMTSSKVETSLIESFIYPKFGPGQMWETVAKEFQGRGGRLILGQKVCGFQTSGNRVSTVLAQSPCGEVTPWPADIVISTMPVKDLCLAMPETWNPEARSIGAKLQYRDFITVGLLYDKKDLPGNLDDNWIYIQEPGVKVGRVQVFNNWSPYLVANPETVWLGLEFFCREGDELWEMSDSDLRALGQNEMFEIGLTANRIAKDAVVIRVPKAYPGYFGEAYSRFDEVRAALDSIENLYPIGRNGMHRYNNQDHSMLTAKAAVEAIVEGRRDRSAIWAINIDDEYHEAK
jgi:protoporphyrinogen oxidase